mgnify:CR=1 FL=1
MTIISISIALGVPFMLLYGRKANWYSTTLIQSLFFGMLIIGLVGFYLSNTNDFRYLFYAFLTVPFYILINYLFKFLSTQMHQRDFYLWIKYSNEIDYTRDGMGKNRPIKTSDIVFSISLLVLIVGMSALGAVLFGNHALYYKLIEY